MLEGSHKLGVIGSMVDAGYNSGRRAVGQGEFPSFPSGQTSIQHRHVPMTKNLRNRQHHYTTLITSGVVSHPPSSSTRLSVPRISQNQHCCRTLPRDVHYQHPAMGKERGGGGGGGELETIWQYNLAGRLYLAHMLCKLFWGWQHVWERRVLV